jgi:hypothetical protein
LPKTTLLVPLQTLLAVVDYPLLAQMRSAECSLSRRCDSGRDANRLKTAVDLGCVKTQKIAERRECFFPYGTKSDLLTNFCASKRAFAKCVFYRIRSPKRFYTAKTHLRHAQTALLQRQIDIET